MPYKKRNNKKKVVRKRKTHSIINLTRGEAHGLPQQAKITFAMQHEANLAAGAATDAVNTYNLNSPYDCLSGLGSAQPPFYDSVLSATGPYLRYRVSKASAKVRFFNLAATPVRVFMYLADAAVDMSLITAYALNNNKNLIQVTLSPKGGDKDSIQLSRMFDFVKLFGKKVITDNDYQGSYTANPQDLIYLYIGAQSLAGATDCNVSYSVDIRQYTRLEDTQVQAAMTEN